MMNDGCPMCQSSMGIGPGDSHGSHSTREASQPLRGAHNSQGQGLNLPFHPVHRHFHTYHAPENNMYPPENAAPAQVQYPYYTFRGPTDFFMK